MRAASQPSLRAIIRGMVTRAASVAVVASLAACGYKGPLYMPAPAPPDAELTSPPQPQQPLTEATPNADTPAVVTPAQ